ncbi:zinc finger protein 62 homolog [Ostrinia nubilalis]|uniref:zinc finger protein 62 homolog n=1 Tax=Ostrinia nubilalis TaxID=29057 RepID=UPI0030822449
MNSQVCVTCRNEKVVNLTDNRLVTESCGHVKCMDCLLHEKSGCSACLASIQECTEPDDEVCGDDSPEPPEVPLVYEKEKEIASEVYNDYEKKKKPETSHIRIETDANGRCYVCTVCNKRFHARSQVAYHAYCNGQRKPFQCPECTKSFATHSHFKYHMRVHRNERTYACDVCGDSFFQMSKLQRHKLKHSTEEKKFVCVQCSKGFNNLSSLRKHELTHSEARPYACAICARRFRDSSNYRKHVAKHDDKKCGCGRGCALCAAPVPERRAHQCPRCPRAFHSRKDMRRHQAVHTGQCPPSTDRCRSGARTSARAARAPSTRARTCAATRPCTPVSVLRPQTGAGAARAPVPALPARLPLAQGHAPPPGRAHRSVSSVHRQVPERRAHQCPRCPRAFHSRKDMRRHQAVHTGQCPPSTDRCRSGARTSARAARAPSTRARTCAATRPCTPVSVLRPQTGAGAARAPVPALPARLPLAQGHAPPPGRAHRSVSSVHRQVPERRAHQCPRCPRAFHSRKDMRRHQAVHTGQCPPSTDRCRTGALPARLPLAQGHAPPPGRAHRSVSSVHRQVPERRAHQCPRCPRAFHSRKDMRRHQAVHTGQCPPSTDRCRTGALPARLPLAQGHAPPPGRAHRSVSSVHRQVPERRAHQCPRCPRAFHSRKDMRRHQAVHTGQCPPSTDRCRTGALPARLPLAQGHAPPPGRAHRSVSSVHRQVPERRAHQCPRCPRAFHSRKDMRRHQATGAGLVRCPRAFHSRKDMRRHQAVHTGQCPPSTDRCRSGARTSARAARAPSTRARTCAATRPCTPVSVLRPQTGAGAARAPVPALPARLPLAQGHAPPPGRAHRSVSSVHRQVPERRAHQCPRCPRAFHSRKDMRRHQAVHTDSKPFRCKVCNRRFRRKDNLERHIRNTHPDQSPATAVDCDVGALKQLAANGRSDPPQDTPDAPPQNNDKSILKILNPLPPLPQEVIQKHMSVDNTQEKDVIDKSYILEANHARQSVIVGKCSFDRKPPSPQGNEYVHKIRKANSMASQKNIPLPPIDEKKILELEQKTSANNLDVGALPKDMELYKKILYGKSELDGAACEDDTKLSSKMHWRQKMKLNIN